MKIPGLRSSYATVGGLVYFGRMLDKIRLHAAGHLPASYNIGTSVWSWFDARCCRFLRIDYEALRTRVTEGGSDEEILEWCFSQGRCPSEEEIEIWNEFMSKRGWRDHTTPLIAQAKVQRSLADRDEILTAFDFHQADEADDDAVGHSALQHACREIQELEMKLADPAFRRSPSMADLLADGFQEFGSSGTVWDKEKILEFIRSEPPFRATLSDFAFRSLGSSAVLLTYRARVEMTNTERTAHSLRSSLWRMTEGKWRILFHQGTPTAH